MTFKAIWLRLPITALVAFAFVGNFAVTQKTVEAKKTEQKQENEGQEDLDEAFDTKIAAQTPRDFDKVCDLCEAAIEKGLNDDSEGQAKELWAATLIEHSDQLLEKIIPTNGSPQDRRWKAFRRDALSRLGKATELTPDSIQPYLMMAKLQILEGGDREKGRAAVMKAVELAGDDNPVELSKALMLRGAIATSERARLADFNRAIDADPANVDAIRARGAQYLRAGNIDKAIDDFEDWIELEPEALPAYMTLTQAYMAEQRVEDAKETLDKGIENVPEPGQLYSLRSRINLQLENEEEAMSDAEEALKINKDDIEALMVRASVRMTDSKFEEALEDVNRVLEIQPGLVRAYWIRSILAGQLDDYDQAIDDIQLLIDNDPENPLFKQQLAMLYNAGDQPEKSVELYDELLEEDPENMDAYRGRGDAFLSLSKHAKAAADYEEALEIAPEDTGVLNNFAWLLATSPTKKVRDGERAIELAKQAAELTDFEQAHILSTLASGYAEAGNFKKAIEWAKKAVEISDNDEQREGLVKELESYKDKKPWREDQFKELQEKREKAEEEDEDEEDDDN